MLYEEIENYFKGRLREETKKWIAENCRSLSEEETDNFKKELFEHSSKIPDIQKLKTVIEKVTKKKPRSYVWAVCLDCGCEYDYEIMTCPTCYKAVKVYNKKIKDEEEKKRKEEEDKERIKRKKLKEEERRKRRKEKREAARREKSKDDIRDAIIVAMECLKDSQKV